MKTIINVLTLLFVINSALYSNSVFTLSGIKEVHPIVKIKTKKLPLMYKDMIKEEIKISLDDLNINHAGDNKRIFAVLVNLFEAGKSSVINIELRISEQVKRLDTGTNTFAATYITKESFTLNEGDDLEDKFEDALISVLDRFSQQYEEENEIVNLNKTKTENYDNSIDITNINGDNFATVMNYETSYNEAIKKAKEQKKNIMLLVVSTHCPWCRKFEQRVLLKKDTNDLIQKNYIPLVLNKNTDKFPKKYNKAISPIVYFIDYKTLKSYDMTVGFNSKEDFLQILKKDNEKNEKTSLNIYK